MSNTPNTTPNIPPPASAPVFIVEEQILRRLRWPLFAPLSDIMVMDDAGDPQSTLRPLFVANQTHPIASVAVTNPPRSRMLINIHAIGTWDYWQDSGEDKPEPLVVENPDGHAITIGELVLKIHEYLSQCRELLNDVFSLSSNSQTQFYFAGFSSIKRSYASDPDLVFPLHVQEDDGNMDAYWAQSCSMVRRYRENQPPQQGNINSIFSQLQGMVQQDRV